MSKGKQNKAAYVATLQQLALTIGVSERQLYRYKALPTFPQPTKRGYHIETIAEWLKQHLQEQQAKQLGDKSNKGKLIEQKLSLQIDILKEQLATIRGQAIPVEQYHRELAEYATVVNQVFDLFCNQVKLENNSKLNQWAETLRDNARDKLLEGLNRISNAEQDKTTTNKPA